MNEKIEYALKDYPNHDYINWEKCDSDLFSKFLSECKYWGYYEFDHCCGSWKNNCWVECVTKGNWGLTYEKVLNDLLELSYDEKINKAIKREPERFVYKVEQAENGKVYNLFLTLRDKKDYSNADYVIVGFESKIDADEVNW